MKRSELFFGAVLLPIDYFALLLAGALAYYLRVNATVQEIRPALFLLDLPFTEYMELVAVVAFVIVGIFATQGLYAMQVTRRLYQEMSSIFTGVSFGVMLLILYMFLSAELFQSRFILLAAYGFALLFISLGRYLVRHTQLRYLERGVGIYRVVLVGNSRYAKQLLEIFSQRPELGYRVVGVPEIVRWDILEELYKRHGIDEVIQADPSLPEEDNLVLLDFCDKYKIDYKYIPNSFETHAAHVSYRQIGGVPVMALERTPLEGWGRVAKRGMDIFGAVFGLVLMAPLLVATAVAIKLESDGPVFYRQTRIGRHRQPFRFYKFRSMYLKYSIGAEYGGDKAKKFEKELKKKSNERTGPLFKMKNDPRITKVGRFIRRWRIDELPQFFNVIHGEMSLLGPRPHLPAEVEQYTKHHQKLFNIKPGMSGMAQVNGNAGLSFSQEASLDIGYIEGWSLRLDIILLLKTFVLLVRDRNAV